MTSGVPHGMTSGRTKCTNGGGAVKAHPASDPMSDGDFPQAYRADDDDRHDDADAPSFFPDPADDMDRLMGEALAGYDADMDPEMLAAEARFFAVVGSGASADAARWEDGGGYRPLSRGGWFVDENGAVL